MAQVLDNARLTMLVVEISSVTNAALALAVGLHDVESVVGALGRALSKAFLAVLLGHGHRNNGSCFSG